MEGVVFVSMGELVSVRIVEGAVSIGMAGSAASVRIVEGRASVRMQLDRVNDICVFFSEPQAWVQDAEGLETGWGKPKSKSTKKILEKRGKAALGSPQWRRK